MKAIVNSTPVTRWGQDEYHVRKTHGDIHTLLTNGFMDIVHAITFAKDEESLRFNMQYISDVNEHMKNEYFKHGFGANHMWVKQIDDEGNTQGENIIFVEF